MFRLDPLAAEFLPLDQRIPWPAERRFALLWDEENGWAAAVTTQDEARLVPASFLAIDVLADVSLVGPVRRGAPLR
ncbi:hypothetical protein GPZ80_09705 [Actinokineospora sp. HBU206404]|uniref:DUF6292 domain-containing protein n=1 Tax=Actinokineospora xionganensis TaxID=2684470 RepID=A0ABR7L536_9PSEU|nr:DUF6292 family protein [Actinokineospora xionganensis]MBC6447442.1 hypothetical protein [Actinokineospora xionganensis]